MYVYVLNQSGKPLMPCKPAIARLLLKEGKAKVKRLTPFTIKLLIPSTEYVQPVVAGMDTGSKKVGCAAISNGEVIYCSDVQLRDDVSKKMQRRASYRRTRRGRKTRYRKPRFENRSMRAERLAPSIRSKIDSHLREKKQVESILPVSHWRVETASFDIHRISNPDVIGAGYQNGSQKNFYNIKAFVLHRDNYKCQSGRKVKHAAVLQTHHIQQRSNGGGDAPSNLITLCSRCHKDLHEVLFELSPKKSKTKHATEMGIIKSQLKKRWNFEETFGYETKYKREQFLCLPKTHVSDAIAICCEDGEVPGINLDVFLKRHVSSGDCQQTKGKRSEKKIPTGKLFGLRKFDLVKTSKGIGFVKGKRSTGYFAIGDVSGKTLWTSANIKQGAVRILARSSTLIERGDSSTSTRLVVFSPDN